MTSFHKRDKLKTLVSQYEDGFLIIALNSNNILAPQS